ncbi:MAG: methylmalonyl-CoA mutase family protein [Sporichthyaceae bacterium]
MTAPTDDLVLGGDFPAGSPTQWEGLVAKVVARAAKVDSVEDPLGTLTTTTADGLAISPLYTASADAAPTGVPGAAPFTRGATPDGVVAGWDVRTCYAEDDPKTLREYVLEDLEGGATSLWLRLGAGGIAVSDLSTALDGVLLDLAGVCLDAAPDSVAAANAYLDYAASRGVDPVELRGSLGVDPIGWAARTGDFSGLDADGVVDLARRAAASPLLRTVVVDALPYHDAGATEAQELALALAAGVAALRTLLEGGLDVATALGQLEFRFAATADQFTTICKLRAARRTWARVAQAAGALGPHAGQRQHAVTSWPMTTVADPWNNMLRTTLAAFAACVGGADAVTVRPFDAAIGRPDALARRIARNTPTLIVEEAHVAKVIDPAGGAWYVESFTEQLAAAAWERFQRMEAAGGIVEVLRAGVVAERLAVSRETTLARLLDGTDSIVGVTVFPPTAENSPARTPTPEVPSGGLPRIRWEELYSQAKEGSA